jgi:ABC-type bacteriocin/lantibiotic exporter with double-glycine peptidase domain
MATTTLPHLTPLKRLFRMLGNERRDIIYLYVYAVVSGLIALSLPLGVQVIIGLISGGLVFSSVYLLIGLVVLGTLLVGLLQIAQISLVEVLQRRVFAKAAIELSYRTPRLRSEALEGSYPPELMNRFFDVLTIQKALPKVLIDITAAVVQILFGVILLSAYHPTFVAFGLVLIGLLLLVIRLSGPRGLETSLAESKYKYKVAHWLEDLARALFAFKSAGNTPLPVGRADELVSGYLTYREKHYKVLLGLFGYAVAFKTLVTLTMLGLGTVLVVDRQISLGQFVAAELVIVLVIGSVDKLMNNADIVFDLLTAVEKLGHVTDLPLELQQGLDVDLLSNPKPLRVELGGVGYRYPDAPQSALSDLHLTLAPGERLALKGEGDSGRNTLLRLLAGLLSDYEGSARLDGFSLRDLDPSRLRAAVGYADGTDQFFAGTLLENLTMGRPNVTPYEVQQTLDTLGLSEAISHLPQGLNTPVLADGTPLASGLRNMLLLVRAALGYPRLLLVGSWVDGLSPTQRERVLDFVTDRQHPWTLLVVANHPRVHERCDRVLELENGRLVPEATAV